MFKFFRSRRRYHMQPPTQARLRRDIGLPPLDLVEEPISRQLQQLTW